MKSKVKHYNGENESQVEDDEIGEIARKASFDKPGGQRGPVPIPSEEVEAPAKNFKQAFAEARRGGDKTFMWQGKKYTTEIAQPKSASKSSGKETFAKRASEVAEVSSKPVRTVKEEMDDVVSRTPLRNPRGGVDIQNALRRMQEVGTAGMKESARQARVDRVRRNVGSNLETYGMKKGGAVKASSASKRADGIAQRGKTRGKMY